ncbi:hypothetical protein [Rhizohabitans arisaemae]|uniref:hypothetical protein n=1 Tax=Rhizohabitans arisaemae TaxID=2720610 RepID=UPI0024B18D02|nr:hypothetical protein [Rhizohabitans arisaemae]
MSTLLAGAAVALGALMSATPVVPQDGDPGPYHGSYSYASAPTFRIFATRVGLVGQRTANGYRIRYRDHFVALPSRRGLSVPGNRDRAVRVCNGELCAYVPVMDVGPWNTRDDYWNYDRRSWRDLGRGVPQAQAAYFSRHNDGRDERGRRVRNPAGIDLGDGTFWDGLGMRRNSWVRVTFLWLGSRINPARVNGGSGRAITVWSSPGRGRQVGVAADHVLLDVLCKTNNWYRIAYRNWVPRYQMSGGESARRCRR